MRKSAKNPAALAPAVLALAALSGGARADYVILDVQGPAPGGTIAVGIHDDWLFLEGCGGTCFAPPVCEVQVTCAPGATPAEVASAVEAAFATGPCAAAGFAATASAAVPGRVTIAWPTQPSYTVCVDGWMFRDRVGCCGLVLATAGGSLSCVSAPRSVCSAGVSSSGCRAQLSAEGIASATAPSGLRLVAGRVEGREDGFFFFSAGGAHVAPWGSSATSILCVRPPYRRAGPLKGSGSFGVCNGSFVQDLNALWCPSCPKPAFNPGVGARVRAQLWYRDPHSANYLRSALSNTVEFDVGL